MAATHVILLKEKVTDNIAVTPDEGQPILNEIIGYIKAGDSLEIDFSGLQICTTAFLNVLIGNLYKDYTSEQLKQIITFKGLDNPLKERIKKVTDRAKMFYKNQVVYDNIIDTSIYGKD